MYCFVCLVVPKSSHLRWKLRPLFPISCDIKFVSKGTMRLKQSQLEIYSNDSLAIARWEFFVKQKIECTLEARKALPTVGAVGT